MILNDLTSSGANGASSVELQTALQANEAKLITQAFELCMTELEFDRKSWMVHLRKVHEWDLRVLHQKDTWTIQRHNSAKTAAKAIMDMKAWVFWKDVTF